MTDFDYVKEKLDSKLFNVTVLCKMTGVSRAVMTKVSEGKAVRPYIAKTLADFFKKIGE